MFACSLAGIFVVLSQCNPVHGFWDFMIPYTCIDFVMDEPGVLTFVVTEIKDRVMTAVPGTPRTEQVKGT